MFFGSLLQSLEVAMFLLSDCGLVRCLHVGDSSLVLIIHVSDNFIVLCLHVGDSLLVLIICDRFLFVVLFFFRLPIVGSMSEFLQ